MPTRKRTRKLGFLSKLMLLLNILAIFVLLLSYSASFIDPVDWWFISLFGLGYLPILLINLCFILYWMIRKPAFALLSLLAILSGGGLLTKHLAFNRPSTAIRGDSTLRVMSYNVHMFDAISDPSISTEDSIIGIIREQKPDILCMQEFESKMKGDKKLTERIKEAGGFAHFEFTPTSQNEHSGYGHVIFSKYPIHNVSRINDYSYGVNRIVYADVVKDRDTLRVYNVHLRSFALQNEDKDFIRSPSGNNSLDQDKIATKRVGKKLKEAFYYRSKQVSYLLNNFSENAYPRIVLGDFNDTPMSYSVNAIAKGMNNAFQKKGSGWGITHFDVFPIFQIDYIFSDLEVDHFEIVKKKFSDHYPIVADLSL